MKRPEVLAPAGDLVSLRAALAAGADAVYFGLDDGFNARARAKNFPLAELRAVIEQIHRAGTRAYITLNTLVFEPELDEVKRIITGVAEAGVDAIIVQDPAVALLARAIAPTLEVHASTQMTISSALGAKFAKEGRFGGSLRVDAGAEVVDKAHGAVAADHDALSPKGAFSIEMWIRPDERLATLKTAFLLDKKGFPYASNRPNANDDYLLQLVKAPGDGEYFIEAQLGFGSESDVLRSRPVKLEAGQGRHVGYSYDGKGTSRVALDGELVGFAQRQGRGPISNGKYRLAIGDRTMSVHAPFSGMIDEVRLSNGLVR